jgi:membrane-associated phospholipid phosphatase
MTSRPGTSPPVAAATATAPPQRRGAVLAGGLGLLAVAAGFAIVIRSDQARLVMGMDEGWLSLVRRSRSAPVSEGFKILSLIGGPVGATIIVCVLGAGLLAVARWRTVIYLGLAEALGSTCSDLIKHYVYRHRPPHPLVAADIGSFPSGHVITTVGVGIALTVIFARPGRRRRALAAVAGAGLLMMFCRTYLAAHWLSDTLESLPVAIGVGLVLWWAFGPLLARDRDRPVRLPSWLPSWHPRPGSG